MVNRTPRGPSEKQRPARTEESTDTPKDSRLFRRREDEAPKDEPKERGYVRGKHKPRIRKEKEFKGSEKEVAKGLRFDKTNPLAARQERRKAEGNFFVAPEAPELKPTRNSKRLAPPRRGRRESSNAETSYSRNRRSNDGRRREDPPAGFPRERPARIERPLPGRVEIRKERFEPTEPEERVERKPLTLKERREIAKGIELSKLPPKPKKKKEGRKYDRPSTIPGERVQKLIANAGLASRREAETWIEQGRVEVNGVVIKLGDKALPEDKVTVNGAPIQFQKHSYYVLHKPKGFVSTRDDKVYRMKTVMDLIPVEERIYPIGRLDKDTTGMLLFTSDGEFANKIMHPRYEVEKTYIATLDKPFEAAHVAALQKGIRLKEGVVRSQVRILSPRKVEVTLHQGFNHVVKRIMKELGYWVTDLHRTKVGSLALDIPIGAFRPLTPAEISLFSGPRSQQGNLPRGR